MPILQRAWSTLEIKAFDDTKRTFKGIASTPTTDRMGDVVEPDGAQYKLPIPFLYQHDSRRPIGQITNAKVTSNGIEVEGYVERVDEPPSLKERLDVAWMEMKTKLVRGLSIGFDPIESARIENTFGFRFIKWDWLELSAVTIPANAEASITAIKSIDQMQLRTASGAMQHRSVGPSPGVSGSALTTGIPREGTIMAKTIQEDIQDAENKRAANMARAEELSAKARDEGRVMDDAESEEYDTLIAEVKAIDKDLVRKREMQQLKKETAAPITPASGKEVVPEGRSLATPRVEWTKPNRPKGTGFTRVALSLLRAKGDTALALENAKQYKEMPEVEQAVRAAIYAKAAVAVGNTTDSAWAAPLVVYQNLASEFVELLRPMTILGKLTGVRTVPFNVSIPRTTAGTTSSWVGEDDPKPVSRMSFETITLGHTKIATIVVISEELVQDSTPAAEGLVQADMLASIAAYSDAQFIDPTVAASGTIRPASITNGLTTHNMTGTAVSNVLTDVQTLMSGFITANLPFTNAVWVMHPRTALYLSMLLSPLGTLQFPGINVNGGTFMGFPVITSASVPIDTGADTYIVLMNASDVLLAETGITVDVSREASVQMDSAPSDSAASMISLWQKNLVGLRAERRICYRRRRDAAVQVLSAVSY